MFLQAIEKRINAKHSVMIINQHGLINVYLFSERKR